MKEWDRNLFFNKISSHEPGSAKLTINGIQELDINAFLIQLATANLKKGRQSFL